LLCEGAGTWNEPYRYWLAVLPTQWETKDAPAGDYWPVVEHLLTCPPRKLTCYQLLRAWPRSEGEPKPTLLDACLAQAVSAGRVLQEGSGGRGDPIRYFLDGLDAEWHPNPGEMLGL
jgi:hypothetical protein